MYNSDSLSKCSGKSIRLIGFEKGFERDMFVDLLQLSHSPLGITGSGSLGEAIATDKSFFYDTAQFNNVSPKLFREIQKFISIHCNENNPFVTFFDQMYALSERRSFDAKKACALGEYYKTHKLSIEQGFTDFDTLIKTKYNAAKNMTQLFNQTLSMRSQEDIDFRKNLLTLVSAGKVTLENAKAHIQQRYQGDQKEQV